jgi:hypothetical protein
MAGLVPAIHVFVAAILLDRIPIGWDTSSFHLSEIGSSEIGSKDANARHKVGHDR